MFDKGFISGSNFLNFSIFPGIVLNIYKNNTNAFGLSEINANQSNFTFKQLNVQNSPPQSEILRRDLMIFEKHPNLKWISTDKKNIFNVTGIIDVYDEIYGISYLVRVNITKENQIHQTLIIYVENDLEIFYYVNNSKLNYSGPFDVLACT